MNIKVEEKTVVVATGEQVSGDLPDGEVVILNLKDSVYYGLNEVGGRIWELIQEPTAVGDIVESLLNDYDVDRERCAQEVIDLVIDLADKGLVEFKHEAPA
jgi:hypothetical protein